MKKLKFLLPFIFTFCVITPSHSAPKFEIWKCWVTGKCTYHLCGSEQKIDTYPADWRYTEISAETEKNKKEQLVQKNTVQKAITWCKARGGNPGKIWSASQCQLDN